MSNRSFLLKFSVLVVLLSNAFIFVSQACTGISLRSKAMDIIQARTIEWAEYNLNSKLIVSPKGESYSSTLPNGEKGADWRNKFGFVGISLMENKYIGEGMNEAGLSAGIFYFKGYGSLAPYIKSTMNDDNARRVVDMDFVRWILSNFNTVDQMLENLDRIIVTPVYQPADGSKPSTGHWRVADASGRSVVIEIVNNGLVQIFDNIGVVTNSPGYAWHKINLSNYLNIEPGTIAQKKFGNFNAKAIGSGTASLGLPGDITPPSRFVRAAFYLSCAEVCGTAIETVAQAFHILNNFDIPIGTEFGSNNRSAIPINMPSATQWTSVLDLTNGNFYYKTMYDSTVKCISISQALKAVDHERAISLDRQIFNYTTVII